MIKIVKKTGFLLLLAVFSFSLIHAQEEEYTEIDTSSQAEFNKSFIYGGNFGLSFGALTSIEFSPVLGYQLTKRFSVNTGPIFEFHLNRFENYRYSLFGFKFFLRYFLIGNIYSHIENETLFLGKASQEVYGVNSNKKLFPVNNFLAGGGIKQPIGEKSGAFLSVLWYVYPVIDFNPVIRVEYMF